MRNRSFFPGLLAVATLALTLTSVPALAARRPAHPPAHAAGSQGYVNPFTASGWEPARTDMGVDWFTTRPEAVLAIGDAVILGSYSHIQGWPGHHLIWYRLLDGSHAGDVIYVAEKLKGLAPAGRVVHAGEQIAIALPGYPGTEWGWAQSDGNTRAAPCYHEGEQTTSGKEMARFMISLGAAVYEAPGPGPNGPSGRLC